MPPGGLLVNFDVSKNLEVLHLGAVDFSGYPGFLKIEQDVQDVACVTTALAGGVTTAKFVHGEENLSTVLHAVAERE